MPENAPVYPTTPDEAQPPFTLPPDLPTFTGRDDLLEALDHLLNPGGRTVVGIVGQAPGVGKSALAIRAAHLWRDRFPEGVIWITMRVECGVCDALRHVAGLYGYHRQAAQIGDDVQKLTALVHTILRHKRCLLVIDDADGLSADELGSLLPDVAGPVTVIVSRRAIPATRRQVQPLQIDVMDEDEALALLGRLIGPEKLEAAQTAQHQRTSAEPGRSASCKICERLARLPLAIDIAGRCARHQGWGPDEILRRLEEAADRPAELGLPAAGTAQDSVALALALSYDVLSADDRELLRALSPFAPAGITPAAAGIVTGHANETAADAALKRLETLALARPAAVAGHYVLHPLLHGYAQALAERAGEQEQWARWHARYFALQADQTWRQSHNPETAWQAVTDTTMERGNFLAAQKTNLAQGLWSEAVNMAYRLDDLFKRSGHWSERHQALQVGIEAARQGGQQREEAGLAHNLGLLAQGKGDYDEAHRLYHEALGIARQLDDQGSVAVTLHNLGILAQKQGDFAEARRLHQQAAQVFERLGDRAGAARALHQLGNVAYQQGNYAEARRQYGASLDIAQQLDDHAGVAATASQMGMLAYLQGNVEQARKMYEKSLTIRRKLGDREGIATNIHQLGLLAEDQGDTTAARRWYREYLGMAQQQGDQTNIAQTLHRLGRMAEDGGDLEEAEQFLTESLALLESLDSPEAAATRRSLERVRGRRSDQPS